MRSDGRAGGRATGGRAGCPAVGLGQHCLVAKTKVAPTPLCGGRAATQGGQAGRAGRSAGPPSRRAETSINNYHKLSHIARPWAPSLLLSCSPAESPKTRVARSTHGNPARARFLPTPLAPDTMCASLLITPSAGAARSESVAHCAGDGGAGCGVRGADRRSAAIAKVATEAVATMRLLRPKPRPPPSAAAAPLLQPRHKEPRVGASARKSSARARVARTGDDRWAADTRMCECATLRMCAYANERTCECVDVRMCECANARMCERANVCECVRLRKSATMRMCACANRRIGGCANVRMCERANVPMSCESPSERMCERANEQMCESASVRTSECANVRTSECVSVRMFEWADMRMRQCTNDRMFECAIVRTND